MGTGNKWPNLINLKSNIRGSADFKRTSSNRFLDVHEVININNPAIDHSVNYDESTAKNFDIITFSNGVKFRIKLWGAYDTINQQVYESVKGIGKLVDTNNNEYAFQNWQIGGAVAQAGGSYITKTSIPAVNTFGIKILLINYFNSNVVEDITECDYLRIVAFVPNEVSTLPSTYRTFVNIVDGIELKIMYDNSMEPDDPSWLYYPKLGSGTTNWGDFIAANITDLNAFAAAVSLGGDPVTVNDLVDESNPEIPPQEDDPSGPGGGDGNYDPTSDPIDFPGLPTGGALSSGAVKAFVVSSDIMIAVFNKLWNTSIFDIDTFQKIVEAPLDSLIELLCVPLTPSTNGTGHIMLGNFDTEQSAPILTNQYITIDCGSKKVNRFWGSALDYEPYTKTEIFLPFIGIRKLHTDDVMNTTLHIKYNIDIFTGNLTAQIKCGQSVLYKFNGNCKSTVPVTSRVNDALLNLVKGAGGIASAGIMGGLPAAGAAAISTAVNVAFAKTHVNRSGDISGVTGLLDDFVPYLIIHRPKQSLAKTFKTNKGYPSNISATLNTLTGYTEIEYIHLSGISGATDTELNEIESLLKSGVII